MLISDEYKAEQQRMHRDIPSYGTASVGFAPKVSEIINRAGIVEILDYGSGKGRLGQNLQIDHAAKYIQYDPGIPGLDEAPDPAEFVCCIDVLEHIEPECLDGVLDDLKRVTKDLGFFTIHTGPAMKFLSDGRNAHLIQEPEQWWLPKIWSRFDLLQFVKTENGFYVIVRAKNGH